MVRELGRRTFIVADLTPETLRLVESATQVPSMLIGLRDQPMHHVPERLTIIEDRRYRIALSFEPPLVTEKLMRHSLQVVRHGLPRWKDPKQTYGQRLRRWTNHRPALTRVLELAEDHPAVLEGRTMFPSRLFAPDEVKQVLIPGENSRKIGGLVTKGKWKGSRIFTLSLEERKTCPRSCEHWRTCYANHMPFTKRLRHGPALVAGIERELSDLNHRYPAGIVVRAHIAGDFWSIGYVKKWARWLQQFPSLRVFGYTAHRPASRIGHEIQKMVDRYWDRFAIRFSNSDLALRSANTIYRQPESTVVSEGVICPAQLNRTETCGTCGLCWHSEKNIAFVAH